MSIADALMFRYFELLSDRSLTEIERLRTDLANGAIHPKAVKQQLAREITGRYYGSDMAHQAEANFEKIFKQHELPDDMPEQTFQGGGEPLWLPRLLADCGLVKGTGEARRLIQQNAVSVDGEKVADPEATLAAEGEYLIKVGKRRFCKVLFS